MLKVGLTGSIAVGKSFVLEILRELGCFVLDADVTAREVVKPYRKGWAAVVENFGRDILNPDDSLNRAKLGAIVFSDSGRLQLLNSIVHPLVIEEQNRWIAEREAKSSAGIAVIDAALMIESDRFKRFNKIIVVWCHAETQLRRLMERNSVGEAEARKRIAAQMSQAEKKRFANYLIDTTAGFESTRQQTTSIFNALSHL
jgi:dephospho-CoA kinase